MTDLDVLEVTVHIAAKPDTVFPYFTDPARYVQWMGSTATLQPVPGGSYRVGIRDGVEATGEFVEIDPPHKVVFTWGWNHDHAVAPGSTRVVVTLREEDDGTRVVLRHYGLPDDEQLAGHHKGWAMYLDRLGVRVTGGDPGPDPNAQPRPTVPHRGAAATRLLRPRGSHWASRSQVVRFCVASLHRTRRRVLVELPSRAKGSRLFRVFPFVVSVDRHGEEL
jgi:uncharacterized protein YndB with AHSA1/START domain